MKHRAASLRQQSYLFTLGEAHFVRYIVAHQGATLEADLAEFALSCCAMMLQYVADTVEPRILWAAVPACRGTAQQWELCWQGTSKGLTEWQTLQGTSAPNKGSTHVCFVCLFVCYQDFGEIVAAVIMLLSDQRWCRCGICQFWAKSRNYRIEPVTAVVMPPGEWH